MRETEGLEPRVISYFLSVELEGSSCLGFLHVMVGSRDSKLNVLFYPRV